MTQVGLVDGEFIINPSQKQWAEGDLKLTVASTSEKVIMIEAGANIVPEAKMIEAIYLAHDVNQTIIEFINKIVAEVGKPKHSYVSCAVPEDVFAAMKEIVTPAEMEVAVFTDEKQVREENIRQITDKFEEAFADNEEWLALVLRGTLPVSEEDCKKDDLKGSQTTRRTCHRPDQTACSRGRYRCLRVHGSAMFTRGQTQISALDAGTSF